MFDVGDKNRRQHLTVVSQLDQQLDQHNTSPTSVINIDVILTIDVIYITSIEKPFKRRVGRII